MDHVVYIVCSDETLDRVQAAAAEGDMLSAPQPVDNEAEGLNAPITGAEIILAAKVVTAVFAAGTAVVKFVREVRAALRDGEEVEVRSQDGDRRLRVKRSTEDSEIESFAAG